MLPEFGDTGGVGFQPSAIFRDRLFRVSFESIDERRAAGRGLLLAPLGNLRVPCNLFGIGGIVFAIPIIPDPRKTRPPPAVSF